MSIFTHVTVGTNDLNKARGFYDKALGELGLKRIADLGDNGSIWGEKFPGLFCPETRRRQASHRRQRRHHQL